MLKTHAEKFDELMNDIAAAPENDDEFEALKEVIEEFWEQLGFAEEERALTNLRPLRKKAARWAKKATS